VSVPDSSADNSGLRGYVHAMYALHALSVLIGVCSSRFVAMAFVFGLPSILAVVMNYARRSDAQNTWLQAHFSWQLRSFWYAALWIVASTLLFGPFVLIAIGIPFLMLAYGLTGLWAAYRIVRGWLALRAGHEP
jgi:uncharacterized membrane protein